MTLLEVIQENKNKRAEFPHFYNIETNTTNHLLFPLLLTMEWDVTGPRHSSYETSPDLDLRCKCDVMLYDDNKNPIVVIEVKHTDVRLNPKKDVGQLKQYYNLNASIRYAILTNMVEMQFFTDFIADNMMDSEPFYTIQLDNPTNKDIQFLEQFKRSVLLNDVEYVRNKYVADVKEDIQVQQKINPVISEVIAVHGKERLFKNLKDECGDEFLQYLLADNADKNRGGKEQSKTTDAVSSQFTLFGELITSTIGSTIFMKFLEEMIKRNPADMTNIPEWYQNRSKSKTVRFSYDKSSFPASVQGTTNIRQLSNEVYVNTNQTRAKMLESCYDILDYLQFSRDSIQCFDSAA